MPTPSISDLKAQKLPAKVGFSGSVPDMERQWWRQNAEAPVAAIPNLSINDYMRSAFIATSGASPTLSLADLQTAYYNTWPAGVVGQSLSDREWTYWNELI